VTTIWDTQRDRLVSLLQRVNESNPFYRSKWAGIDLSAVRTAADFATLPFTSKAELASDQADFPPYGTNLSSPLASYTRLHQTSGTTTGKPLRWLDTPAGWDWVLFSWQSTFSDLGITPADRCYFPFSFGPFLGFWSAFDATVRNGNFVLSGGGTTSTGRLRQIVDHGITTVFCTPTYALHLAEVAVCEGIDLAASAVRTLVVAGEPGGNIPATKARIESGWGARCLDHYGLTEVGPVAFEMRDDPGFLTVIEREIIAEIVEPDGTKPVDDGNIGELVVTNLGRGDNPLIRYRTGDLVHVATDGKPGKNGWRRFAGGTLGRADDMLTVRGNNLYPAAVEAVVRRFPSVADFRIVVRKDGPLDDVTVELEPTADAPVSTAEIVARALRDEFLFRIDTVAVPPGTLPRFEMKARRVVAVK
jgi:phenylacetate-CoA ligase